MRRVTMKSNKNVRIKRRGRIRPVQEYLPPDICTEILCRLPVKDLLKFRLVCKTWRSIIDDPQFVSLHLKCYKNNVERSHLFLVEEHRQYYPVIRHSDTYRKMGVPDKSLLEGICCHDFIQIVGYIDGLFVFWVRSKDTMTVSNPSMKRYVDLPPFPRSKPSEYDNISLGFGYDPSTNDYKVVSVWQQGSSKYSPFSTVAYLYTFGSRSWRGISCDDHFSLFSEQSVYLNGNIYWATQSDLISFDVVGEFFSHYNIPDYGSIVKGAYMTIPVILGESLALFSGFLDYCCLWMRDEYAKGENWIKLHNIIEVDWFSFVYLKMNGEILFTSKGLRSYDINTHETKVLAKSYRAHVVSAHAYVESLVWPRETV